MRQIALRINSDGEMSILVPLDRLNLLSIAAGLACLTAAVLKLLWSSTLRREHVEKPSSEELWEKSTILQNREEEAVATSSVESNSTPVPAADEQPNLTASCVPWTSSLSKQVPSASVGDDQSPVAGNTQQALPDEQQNDELLQEFVPRDEVPARENASKKLLESRARTPSPIRHPDETFPVVESRESSSATRRSQMEQIMRAWRRKRPKSADSGYCSQGEDDLSAGKTRPSAYHVVEDVTTVRREVGQEERQTGETTLLYFNQVRTVGVCSSNSSGSRSSRATKTRRRQEDHLDELLNKMPSATSTGPDLDSWETFDDVTGLEEEPIVLGMGQDGHVCDADRPLEIGVEPIEHETTRGKETVTDQLKESSTLIPHEPIQSEPTTVEAESGPAALKIDCNGIKGLEEEAAGVEFEKETHEQPRSRWAPLYDWEKEVLGNVIDLSEVEIDGEVPSSAYNFEKGVHVQSTPQPREQQELKEQEHDHFAILGKPKKEKVEFRTTVPLGPKFKNRTTEKMVKKMKYVSPYRAST